MKKTLFVFLVCAVLVLFIGAAVYASSVYTMTYKPGTTDTVTNMPQNDSGTGGEAYIVSSTIPQREGYKFIGWKLDYGDAKYTVTYAVKPDPVYGVPDDSIVPTDPSQYLSGDVVTLAEKLTTSQTTAINALTGEERFGVWTFYVSSQDNFKIYEDTTITGEWIFTPLFKYTVHHLDIDTYNKLADDDVIFIPELTEIVAQSKTPARDFYTAYQKMKYNPVADKVYLNKRADFLLPGATYVKNKTKYEITVTLTEDDQHIFFFYQRPSAG